MDKDKSPLDAFKLEYELLPSEPAPKPNKRLKKLKLKPIRINVRPLGLPKVVIINRTRKTQEARP